MNHGNVAKGQGERIRRGMLERVRGGLPSGTVQLGYRLEGRGLVREEPAAGLVAYSFARILEGLPVRTSLLRATEAGLLSRRGLPLSLSSFQNLVTNPIYAGYVRFGGKLYRGRHEPIVREDDFWRAQRMIGSGLIRPATE